MNTTHFEYYSAVHIPSSKLFREYILLQLPVVVVLITALLICTSITILNMCLYIYYRKTPEIMATSAGKSTIVFLSCYAIYMLVVGLILIGVSIMLMEMNIRIIV